MGLYGTADANAPVDESYESPEEYADQGDTRVVRDLSFSYLVAEQDAAGNEVLTPRDVSRDTEVSVEQIGLVALEKGERLHSFYTTKELEALEGGGEEAVEGGGSLSDMGEYELADWIKGKSVNQVLEVVGDDKDLAERMLQAENIATNGDPRTTLEKGLQTVIEEN